MSVAGTKNFDQPPHDSNRTHLVFSTSGLLLGSRAFFVSCLDEIRGLLVPQFLECCHGSDVGMAQGLATGTWAGTGGTNEKR